MSMNTTPLLPDGPRRLGALALLLVLAAPVPAGEHWPGFRGPTGLGLTDERTLPLTWGGPTDANVLWKAPLVGQGHASPVVWGDRLFVSTARWPEPVKDRARVIPEHHVLCYAVRDGQLLWDAQVKPGPWLRSDFRSGPGGGYACPTPATDGRRVYCVFGSAVLAALDFDGRLAWRQEIVPYTFDVTVGTSPVLYRGTLLMLCAMARKEDSRLIAYDPADGRVKWQTPLPTMGFGHSTPVVVDVDGRPQMLVLAGAMGGGGEALRSLDPDTGKTLWWCAGGGESASPAYGAGLVYFDSGRGGPGVAVQAGGQGDVTRTQVRWKVQVPGGLGSPVIVDGRVYRLHEPNVLKCWDAAGGKELYARRLDGIGTTWASPVVDPAGRIFFASAGKSYVVQAGPEFRVLATNDLGDGSHPSPAVAGGRLFLVGAKHVWCVGQARR